MVERVQTDGNDERRPKRMPETAIATGIRPNPEARWASYALLGAIVVALTASFFPAWQWSSESWFRIGFGGGGTNEGYSPGPLIPLMVLLMLSTHLRRLRPTPELGDRDMFHAAFVRVLVPIATGVLKLADAVTGKTRSRDELEALAYTHRAIAVWVAWGVLGGAMSGVLYVDYHTGYAAYHRVTSVVGPILLFVNITVFCAAVLYVAWRTYYADKRAPAAAASSVGQIAGYGLLVFFLVFQFAAVRGDTHRLSVVAFLGCLVSLVWYFYGWRVARIFVFPLAFMVFTLPMEWIEDKFGLPAQMLATKASVGIMEFIGVKVQMTNLTAFKILRQAGDVDFAVAAPCSGLKSLVALTAIAATYAYLTQRQLWKIVVMTCIFGPIIAIIANIVRLVAVGIIAQFYGRPSAMWVHDHALPIYILAILLLMGVDKLLNAKWLKIENF